MTNQFLKKVITSFLLVFIATSFYGCNIVGDGLPEEIDATICAG
jgi:hypothetical protein